MDKNIYIIISNNIKKYRQKKGYTINDLAISTGINKNYLTEIEKNGVDENITFENLMKICIVLDVNIIQLLKEKEKED